MALPPINWLALLDKYGSSRYPDDVRHDIGQLIAANRQLLADNIDLATALQGAKRTMIALTRACGSLELPFDTVTTVDEKTEALQVDDVRRGDAHYKRFTYVRRLMN
jgi:hypothetical protein